MKKLLGGLLFMTSVIFPALFLLVETDISLGEVLAEISQDGAERSQLEQHILHSTVRIEIESWMVAENEQGYVIDDSSGHATLLEGGYLLTHNHFTLPLSIRRREGEPETYNLIRLYDYQGRLLHEGPLSDFELVREEKESLLIVHQDANYLEGLGLETAEYRDLNSMAVEAGMAVAQIDWDGQTTRVDWVTVREVREIDGVPVMVLDDGALRGASGGGIFLDGYHVANNWRIEEQIDSEGEIINSITVAAMNRVVEN